MREDVIRHIVGGRDLLHSEENIQRYIDIIQNKVFIRDPFDRAIAVIFELVIDREVDPRQIDLVSFSRLYVEKVKKEGIDLFIAGKIVLMAWKILRLQSEEIIRSMKQKKEEPLLDYEIPDWYGDDDVFTYTQKVMHNEVPLEKKIRRVPQRRVTLIELLNAFEEAKEEIKKRSKKRRSKEQEWSNVYSSDTMHKEDIEFDMQLVMKKLSTLNGQAIPLRQLYEGKDELLTMILPLLFLAKDERIFLWQEDFPYGEIFIKMNHGS
jgi:segregation and condensation protein A